MTLTSPLCSKAPISRTRTSSRWNWRKSFYHRGYTGWPTDSTTCKAPRPLAPLSRIQACSGSSWPLTATHAAKQLKTPSPSSKAWAKSPLRSLMPLKAFYSTQFWPPWTGPKRDLRKRPKMYIYLIVFKIKLYGYNYYISNRNLFNKHIQYIKLLNIY